MAAKPDNIPAKWSTSLWIAMARKAKSRYSCAAAAAAIAVPSARVKEGMGTPEAAMHTAKRRSKAAVLCTVSRKNGYVVGGRLQLVSPS